MDGRTNEQKISPFYRTSSPIGAAAQKEEKEEEKEEGQEKEEEKKSVNL